jgi:hypothetical protein
VVEEQEAPLAIRDDATAHWNDASKLRNCAGDGAE